MKMLARTVLLLTFLGAAVPHGQGQDKDKDKVPQTPYYPLAVGTTWTYKVGANRYDIKVAKHEMVGKAMCARLEMVIDNKVKSFEHVGQAGDYLARYTFEKQAADPPIPFLKLPPKKGDKWKVEAKIGDGQVIKGQFTIDEATISVPAGKDLKTIKVEGKDMEANGVKISCTYYFAEGLGLVKQELEMEKVKIVIELEKYEAGKS